jgi:uncharacterized HAD superfamily protein
MLNAVARVKAFAREGIDFETTIGYVFRFIHDPARRFETSIKERRATRQPTARQIERFHSMGT